MAKKTSLNKGLEALLGDVAESKNSEKPQKNVKKETKEKSSEILLSQIRANQYQPRTCLLYTSPSPRDNPASRMPSSA